MSFKISEIAKVKLDGLNGGIASYIIIGADMIQKYESEQKVKKIRKKVK